MKVRFFILNCLCLLIAPLSFALAQLNITKQTCNHQAGLAIVDSGNPFFGWQMQSDLNGDYQKAYQIEVRENGTNKPIFTSKKIKSAESQLVSQPISQPSLADTSHGYKWRVKVWNSKNKPSDWSGWQLFYVAPNNIDATWVGAISKKDAKIPDGKWSNTTFKQQDFKDAWQDVDTLSSKSIEISESFCLNQSPEDITNAVIYISGLGHYILDINGNKVTDAEFAPLWTDYGKTVYYNIYDLTSILKTANTQNRITVLLGNGMYNVQKDGRYTKFQSSFGAPKLFYNLIINYKDGSQQTIKTDGNETCSLSNISFNSIYGGESVTLGREKKLLPLKIVEAPSGKLLPQTAPPVKVNEKYSVKSWNYADSTHTTFVCDMGQNLAGFPELKYSNLTPGKTIKLIVSEKLDKNGLCNQKQTGRPHFYSIETSETSESAGIFTPHFSYYGFCYIQVEGAVMKGEPNPENLPVIEELKSCFVHNSAEEYSSFSSSNKLFSDTHRLIERAERSNMQSVFTDCPHREKLGWLEQDQLCGPSLLYNYDLTTFGPKFIHDICDAQHDNGFVPTIAPQYVEFGNKWGDFDDSPEWGSTLIIFPFQYYAQYGDDSLIKKNYKVMCRYIDYLTSRAENGILNFGLGDWYDYQANEAAGFSKNTPVPLVATAHYILDLQLMVKASEMMEQASKSESESKSILDEQKFSDFLEKTIDTFNAKFFHADSCYYGNNSQCSNALPLYLGICPKDKEGKVYANLIASLYSSATVHDASPSGKPRLTTGDVGNRYLIQTLSQRGDDKLVYDMFNHYETPGYGFQLKQGMTTLTEQWNPQYGTSLNHFMMGHLDEWLFASMAGIRNVPGTYGLRDIIIRPFFADDAQEVSAETSNLYGRITVKATPTEAEVHIPVGCKATVMLPGKTFKVGSGTHKLTSIKQ